MPNSCDGCKYWRTFDSGVSNQKACHYLIDKGQPKGCRADNCDKREVDPNYIDKRRGEWVTGKLIETPPNHKFRVRK